MNLGGMWKAGCWKMTKAVAMFWGDRFPMYYVCEFPRSGGTWLARMIADYLQIPCPRHSVFPVGCKAVLHNHWRYTPRLREPFYLYRDGRDLAVSMYFLCIRGMEKQGTSSYFVRRFPRFGEEPVEVLREDAPRFMPGFIDAWATRPFGCGLSWKGHVTGWTQSEDVVIMLSYEELLEDCHGTLKRVLEARLDDPVDDEALDATIHKFSFEKQTGRKRGQESKGSLARKGISGDWKNYFSRAAGEAFQRHCGDVLIKLGYEEDGTWVDQLPAEV